MFAGLYSGRRILLTGHTGFKGSWLSLWLQKLQASVLGLSLPPEEGASHFALLRLNLQSKYADISDFQGLRDIVCSFQPELIFHLAAQSLVRKSYHQALQTIRSNVLGTANLLEAARHCESLRGIVVVSSDKCYANQEKTEGYREEEPLGGYDPYSASKACAEILAGSWRDSFFNLADYGQKHRVLVASARSGNVIGGGDWAEDRIVPDLMRSAISKQALNLRCPRAVRPWQHVLEALSGYLLLGQKMLAGDKLAAQAWNFGPSEKACVSVEKIARTLQRHWPEITYTCEADPSAPHETGLLRLNCQKARKLLHWRPVWSSAESFRRCAQWYRDFYEEKRLRSEEDLTEYCQQAEQKGLAWSQ